LRGLISHRSGRSVPNCEFKANKGSSVTEYTADQVLGYEVDLARYETVKLDTDTLPRGNVFMRVLAKGAIDLYRYKRYFFLMKDDELIGLPEPLLVSVTRPGVTDLKYAAKDARTVIILNQIVQECGMNANETSYNSKDMTALVIAYNTCKKDNQPLPKKPTLRVNYQAFASYGTSVMNYDYYKVSIDFDPCRTIHGGIGIDLTSPILSDRLSLSTEFWYTQMYYQGYYEGPTTGGTLRQDLQLDMTYLKFPVGVRYAFQGTRSAPYVKLGVAFGRVSKNDFNVVDEVEITADGSVYMEGTFDVAHRVKTNPRRVWAAIGYEQRLRKLRIFGEVRGEYGGGFVGDVFDAKSTLAEFNILGGIRF